MPVQTYLDLSISKNQVRHAMRELRLLNKYLPSPSGLPLLLSVLLVEFFLQSLHPHRLSDHAGPSLALFHKLPDFLLPFSAIFTGTHYAYPFLFLAFPLLLFLPFPGSCPFLPVSLNGV